MPRLTALGDAGELAAGPRGEGSELPPGAAGGELGSNKAAAPACLGLAPAATAAAAAAAAVSAPDAAAAVAGCLRRVARRERG
jgi:hypothetical protein